jgi:hypothetical protein
MIIDVRYRMESNLFGTLYFPSKHHLQATIRKTCGLPGHEFYVYEKLLKQEDGTFAECKGPFEVHYGVSDFSSAVLGPVDSFARAVEVYNDMVKTEHADFSDSEIWRKVQVRVKRVVTVTLDGEGVDGLDD